VGERGLKDGKIEYVDRRSLRTTLVPIGDVLPFIGARLSS
jgi:hypothetical protein